MIDNVINQDLSRVLLLWSDILNCGFEIKWAMILAVTNAIWAIAYRGLKKSELQRRPQFNIWNISYITSYPFFVGLLELTNDQLSSSVASLLSWLERRTSIARSRILTPLKFWLFQASIRNCLNCVHNWDNHSSLVFKSAVQYMKHFIYHFTSILHGLIRTHKWPPPNVSGFIAQLVRASHRYCEVTGSNLVEVLTHSGFYTQLLKMRS